MTSGAWDDVKSICAALWRAGLDRVRPQRIRSRVALVEFIHSRAAYIGQTALYGYLKTRTGTRFRELFQDERFANAIRLSRSRVIEACLQDLTVFATGLLVREGGLSTENSQKIASDLYTDAIKLLQEQDFEASRDDATAFRTRLSGTDWRLMAIGEAAFSTSPTALVKHAPVIDDYKELDREIVMNSVRFRWADVRGQMSRRLNATDVVRDMSKPLT